MFKFLTDFFKFENPVASKINKSKPRLFVFSGAGLSADSGISTYRTITNKTDKEDNINKNIEAKDSEEPLWQKYDAKIYSNFNDWEENREKLFDFWNERKTEMMNAQPNRAHIGLANLQKQFPNQVYITTQNIDILLEKAGCDNILHVHGRVDHMECLSCNNKWYIGNQAFNTKQKCPECGNSITKPAIVLFGQAAPLYKQLYSLFDFRQRKTNDIILCVGTSFEVIELDYIIGYNEHQPGFKILSNYEASPIISEERFDKVFYGSVDENWDEIEKIIKLKLK